MSADSIVAERGDREWQDGDDSELYDSGYADGYAEGVLSAYHYVIDELGLDISDSDLLSQHGIQLEVSDD